MRQLEYLRKKLMDRDRYILIPNSMKDYPIQMSKMQKDDEEGNLLVGEYYTVQDLADYFGKFYTIIPWVDDSHSLITWGSSANGEMTALKDSVLTEGLVNVRDGGGEFELETSDVDWANIPENGFAIFSLSDLRDVPKVAVVVEEVGL
ncbi:MAG: hypothetical protein LHW59_05460 [Candidatus Cloacimonetes bacterium]|nr:hypothetical protein [Candidatus Cloacimonadota bacterium]